MPTTDDHGFPIYTDTEPMPDWDTHANTLAGALGEALDAAVEADRAADSVENVADIPVTGNWVGRHLYVEEDESIRLCKALPASWVIIGYSGAWTDFTPEWVGSVSDPTVSAAVGRLKIIGKTCEYRIHMVMGSSAGSGSYEFPLPFTAHTDGRQSAVVWINISGLYYYSGVGMIQAGGVSVTYVNGNFGAEGAILQHNNPAWTTGSEIVISGVYEVA